MLKELYENRKKAWIIFECIICILIFVVTLRLFYYQITDSEVFPSDTPEHIGFALRGVGYSYLMPAIGIIMNAFGIYGYVAVAVFEALAIITTIYVSKRTIMYCGKISEKPAFVISVSLMFLSSLYIPVLQPLFYKSGIVSQPWHNITYIFMRLFAVLTIAGTWYTLSKYQECLTMKEWGGIAIPLCLSTAVKPSFLIGYSWALLLFLIIDVIRERFAPHAFVQCIKLGTSVFPSLIIMYFQATDHLYKLGGESGIEFSLMSSKFFSFGFTGTIIKLIRGLLLVSIVVFYNRKRLIKEEYFIIAQYLMSLFVLIFFHETGNRASHGNFAWGIYSAGYLLMAFAWTRLANNYSAVSTRRKKLSTYEKCYFVICVILSVWHVASGVAYFTILSMGGRLSGL